MLFVFCKRVKGERSWAKFSPLRMLSNNKSDPLRVRRARDDDASFIYQLCRLLNARQNARTTFDSRREGEEILQDRVVTTES